MIDSVREAIAKALHIPPGDVEITGLSDTSQGGRVIHFYTIFYVSNRGFQEAIGKCDRHRID